jgi:hypothetical protein
VLAAAGTGQLANGADGRLKLRPAICGRSTFLVFKGRDLRQQPLVGRRAVIGSDVSHQTGNKIKQQKAHGLPAAG